MEVNGSLSWITIGGKAECKKILSIASIVFDLTQKSFK